jgi:threonylcarbamoyladenosine tRNA methylthiotransferase MtaB
MQLKNKKVFIRSYGCKVNQYETQLITDFCLEHNNTITQNINEAEAIIINSCTVTENADKECEYFIRKASKLPNKPQIILTGCFKTDKYPYVQTIKKEALFQNPSKQVIKNFANKSRAFVKIQDGCESFCSYCIVPYVRNKQWSKPAETALSEIKNLVSAGHAEIVLTGIHVGKYAYGLDKLLNEIIKINLPFRVRLSSIEVNEISEEIIQVFKNYSSKLCCHFHIPLQSASDKVLSAMRRNYTRSFYEQVINKLKNEIPNLALTTDVIVGFPQETEKDFEETFNFTRDTGFSDMHVFRYSDRAGTKAFEMDGKISAETIKERSKKLLTLKETLKNSYAEKFLGKKLNAVMIGENEVITENYLSLPVSFKQPETPIFKVTVVKENGLFTAQLF